MTTQAHAEATRKLRISDRREGRGLFVAHLDETNFVLPLAQRFHEAVDAITGQAKDGVDAPLDQAVDEDVRAVALDRCVHGLTIRDFTTGQGCRKARADRVAKCSR